MLKDRIKEIGNLILLHFKQNWPYTLATIAIFMIFVSYQYWVPAIDTPQSYIAKWDIGHYNSIRKVVLIWFFVIIWANSLLTLFRGYARRQRLHDTLMLPVNRSSTFATEMLCSLVIMPLVLAAIWTTIDAVDIIRYGFPSEYHSMEWFYRLANNEDFLYTMAFVFSIHSLVTLWRASHNIILCVGICLVAFGMLVLSANSDIIYPFTYGDVNIYSNIRVATSQINYFDISIIPIKLAKGIHFAFIGAIPIALYSLAYYKFKERNVR